jgi:hypothetical protein
MRLRRSFVAALAACLGVTAVAAPPVQADPSAEEVKAQIAALEAEYAAVTDALNNNQNVLAQAQAQLESTTAQLQGAEERLAEMNNQVVQVALYQMQSQDLSQSLLLFSSDDATTMMDKLIALQQVDYTFTNLLSIYQAEQEELAQLKAAQEQATITIANSEETMKTQLAEIKAKEAEARSLRAKVVSPRDVGDNTGLTPHAIEVKGTLAGVFTQITNIGGYRAGDWGDHGSGRALDVMIPGWSGADGIALGDSIARWCQDNYRTLDIKYLIWRQRYWQAGWGVNNWQWMADRGSPTQNHYDHVHISLNSGPPCSRVAE